MSRAAVLLTPEARAVLARRGFTEVEVVRPTEIRAWLRDRPYGIKILKTRGTVRLSAILADGSLVEDIEEKSGDDLDHLDEMTNILECRHKMDKFVKMRANDPEMREMPVVMFFDGDSISFGLLVGAGDQLS